MTDSRVDPVPPAPQHTPPLREDDGTSIPGKFFSQAWFRWFLAVREKVNVLNTSFVNLADVTGSGYLVKVGALWLLRTIQGTSGNIIVTNNNGEFGNTTINLASTGVTAGTYGDDTHTVQITVDSTGRITSITNIPITFPAPPPP